MTQKSCMLFTTLQEDDPEVLRIRSVASHVGFSFGIVNGEADDMITEFASWEMLPELLLVDIPKDTDPEDFLGRLIDVAPEGEADTIVLNGQNDIDMYRRLKEAGVVEVFTKMPTDEELENTLTGIFTREARETGIDPRRAVYVWGTSGGCGSTTFALAFAHHMAKKGRRTLVLDMDLYTAPASFMLAAEQGAEESGSFLDMLANPSRIDGLFLQRGIVRANKNNLFYLSSRQRANGAQPLSKSLPILIEAAQKSFDMVVIDTPWRGVPETDWGKVNGQNYIVSLPSAAGLLGFSSVSKDLSNQASRNPIFGILNKQGEFKANDITPKMFGEGFSGKILPFPYDPVDAGKLFFAQKTFDELSSGRARKPMHNILKTLPEKAENFTKRKKIRRPQATTTPVAVQEKPKGLLSRLLGR